MTTMRKFLVVGSGVAVAAGALSIVAAPAYAGATNEFYYHWEDCNRRVQQLTDGQTGAECKFEAVGGGRYLWHLYTYGT
ncbi:hypothetical protein ACIA49_28730 [Kribbella sp. NPDC051587]|uniref:hypothetical protein n=1 Tax=Kribbella sp. NPDC051587 TaxID=3364119 RepID=UPI00379DB5A8